jgi:uncharacterized iron-regulated protein
MIRSFSKLTGGILLVALSGCATPIPPLDTQSLSEELARRPVVLLGEVHDNEAQHQVRAAALKRFLEAGARPSLAFEQFDRERQADIDRARDERPPEGQSLADHVIERGIRGKGGWNWTLYRPYVELALEYGLPIVAANLSREDAGRIAREGAAAVFSETDLRRLGLDRRDDGLQSTFEAIVQEAHCNLLPTSALPGLARAQIARDAVLADSIRPFLARGVVLLTGNGHARLDVGVPLHFTPEERRHVWSIGLLETGAGERPTVYNAAFLTPAQPRDDPCQRVVPRGK